MYQSRLSELVQLRYQVHEQIGAGEIGCVYRATDRLRKRALAIKLITGQPRGYTRRETGENLPLVLGRHLRCLGRLRHPHLLPVLDSGFLPDDDGQPHAYYTMPLLNTAPTLLKAGEMQPIETRIGWLIQAFEALDYLHRHRVVHGNLKPANVRVQDGTVRVLDYGLSPELNELHSDSSLAYVAPEVLRGGQPGPASDLYSAGLLAYQLLTGHFPFRRSSRADLIDDILNAEVDFAGLDAITRDSFLATDSEWLEVRSQSPDTGNGNSSPSRSLPSDVPDRLPLPEAPTPSNLAGIIHKLLANDPAERHPNARAVIEDLSQAIAMPLLTEPPNARMFFCPVRLIGRQNELKTLRLALEEALAGKGRTLLIGGESGTGKTRLLDEIALLARLKGMTVLYAEALFKGSLTFHLWCEPLRQLLLAVDISEREAAILQPLIPDIATLIGRALPHIPIPVGSEWEEELFRTITSLFKRYGKPLLLILEDLHRAGHSFRVLRHIQSIVNDLPLLLLVSYRDDEYPDLPDELAGTSVLSLGRLSDEEIGEFASDLLNDKRTDAEVVSLLQRESTGNPFLLIEACCRLNTLDQSQDEPYNLPAHLFQGSLHHVLAGRIGHTPGWARPMLEMAALQGSVLDLAVLGRATAAFLLERTIHGWLLACSDAGVLEMRAERWHFSHDKLRETIISGIPAERRAAFNARLAEAIEATYPHDDRYAGALAFHWRAAGNPSREKEYALKAAQQALRRAYFAEAIEFLEHLLELLLADPSSEHVETQYTLGLALLADEQHRAAAHLFAAIAERSSGPIAVQARALLAISRLHEGDMSGGQRLLTLAAEEADTYLSRHPDRSRAWYALGLSRAGLAMLGMGEMSAAQEAYTRGQKRRSSMAMDWQELLCLQQLARLQIGDIAPLRELLQR